MKKIMTVFGTRPEAIKVAPVIEALEASDDFISIAISTGQHREMLDQVTQFFGLKVARDLNIIKPNQTLTDISVGTLKGVEEAIKDYRPDAVLVQGDTATSTFAAIAAFYAKVPVFHLEAGLRTGDIYSPYPEEANRKITSQIAALHLAPTVLSKNNLLRESVRPERIIVTGNTVIDALHTVLKAEVAFDDARLVELASISSSAPIMLVTAHRRENQDGSMEEIGHAIADLVTMFPELRVLLPLHRNPRVRDAILPQIQGMDRVVVTEPLGYAEFARAMAFSAFVLTDSGGVQEEAPSIGKPVLVMRDTTERPEAVVAGTVRLIGTDRQRIVDEVSSLLSDSNAYEKMAGAVNPYGDGSAARRTLAAFRSYFGIGSAEPDFGGA